MKTKTVILATDISGLGKVAATAALPLFQLPARGGLVANHDFIVPYRRFFRHLYR